MIDGKFWPVDEKRTSDGYGLSLKNAKKLLNTAHEQFKKDPPDYALCIFLAASAIEEVGKGIMIMEDDLNGTKISAKRWDKKYEQHDVKITAAVNNIRKFVEKGDKKKHKALDEIRVELLEMLEQKFASLYVDWDASRNDWSFFDELLESKKRDKAKSVLKAADWLVSGYILDGKLITERKAVIIEMVKQGLAVADCGSCAFQSNNFKEITQHRDNFQDHKIGFREV